MTNQELARHIQFTNVNPEMTRNDLIAHCEAAIAHGFDAAMIAPCWMPLALDILKGSSSHVATAFSFPSGNDSTAMKAACVREILKSGVRGILILPHKHLTCCRVWKANTSKTLRRWPIWQRAKARRLK